MFSQYDSTGKLVTRQHRTYIYTLGNFSRHTGISQSVKRGRGNESKGTNLADMPAMALAMLSQPESHFRLASPTQPNPRRVDFLFRSKPCRKPHVVRGWFSLAFQATCFAGRVVLSSADGELKQLSARALRLPVSGSRWPFVKKVVFDAYTFRMTFHEVSLPHETKPFLVPQRSWNTMRYSNGRIVVTDSFEPAGG